MADRVDLRRIGIDPGRAVAAHGVVVPARLPELVEEVEVVVGTVVAAVVLREAVLADRPGGAVEIARHDVPADAATREVVQRRHAPGERVRVFAGDVDGDAEAEVAGHRRHGGDQQRRLVDGQLDRFPRGEVDAAAVDVVDAGDVGDENRVEQPALQRPGEVGPMVEPCVVGRAITRMRPQAVVDVAHAVHREGVEDHLAAG